MDWQISQPQHLWEAINIALLQGRQFLSSRLAPDGPIGRIHNLSYVHKPLWGLYSAGADHDTIVRVLDWTYEASLRPNGDFYFDEEPTELKDLQRLYRPLTFVKLAAWLDHPMATDDRVIQRILQYQDRDTGAVAHAIGDDPRQPQWPELFGTLNTTFFGHLMLALDMKEPAVAAGDWAVRWVRANRPHIEQGRLISMTDRRGELAADVPTGEQISRSVEPTRPRQEFWQAGTVMAYLATLYEQLTVDGSADHRQASEYLDAALELLPLEDAMPLDTYLWPSKCKAGWGAAELLRLLSDRPELGDSRARDAAYRVAERVAMFTFLDNQLPDGAWQPMHYPLNDDAAELVASYKPLKGLAWSSPTPLADSATIFLPPEEMTGEFLGELKAIERGVHALIQAGGATPA